MLAFGLPILCSLFLWWFATGAILYLDGLPQRTHRWTMLGATIILIVSLIGIVVLRQDTSVAGAYLGFGAALGIWGWNEMAFLTGLVTGPWRTICPPEARGWRRIVFCSQMVIHHELAILVSGLAIVALSIGAENQVGMSTFLVLWVMRLSTKFNLFLGVPNAPTSFLPDHLAYMASAFATRPINALLPVSIAGGAHLTGLFVRDALTIEAPPFAVAEACLLATITGLAVIEHLFFVLPLPSEALWSWGKASHRTAVGRTDGFTILPTLQRSETLGVPVALTKLKE